MYKIDAGDVTPLARWDPTMTIGDRISIIIGAISHAQTPYLSATLDKQKRRGKERENALSQTLPSRDTSRDAGRPLNVRYCTLGARKACQKCTRAI